MSGNGTYWMQSDKPKLNEYNIASIEFDIDLYEFSPIMNTYYGMFWRGFGGKQLIQLDETIMKSSES